MGRKKYFDGDGKRDARRSEEWNEGFRAGWRAMRAETGNMLRPLVREFSDDYAQQRYNPGGALYRISRLYAFVYGSMEMFDSVYESGRLMSEPEIRFRRLAQGDEIHSTFEALTKKWTK